MLRIGTGTVYAFELRSSVFSSAVNIWNWLASQLGRSGGKGHVRVVRENPVFLSKNVFKRRIFKKAEIFELNFKSVRCSSKIHVSMFLLSK